jgi:hypothetical protein
MACPGADADFHLGLCRGGSIRPPCERSEYRMSAASVCPVEEGPSGPRHERKNDRALALESTGGPTPRAFRCVGV